jgi:hypothetical protein
MAPNDWMSQRAREEIEFSIKVHNSVKEELKSSPIILSTPNVEILHQLHLPNKGSTRTRLSPEEWRNDIFIRVLQAGYKVAADLSPPVDDRELALREEWYEGGAEATDTHPHACALSGIVLIGVVIEDEDTGEEVEILEAIPCRRCAEAGA